MHALILNYICSFFIYTGGMMLIIKACLGNELEKERSNSPEDSFTRSEVTFVDQHKEKTLYVLYVKYFEELLSNQNVNDPLTTIGDRPVFFRDIAALLCLLHNPENQQHKRIYISSQKQFLDIFEKADYKKALSIYQALQM